jgi:hypothetical protein
MQYPLLVITGDCGRLIPWQDTKRIADEAQNATWMRGARGVVRGRGAMRPPPI